MWDDFDANHIQSCIPNGRMSFAKMNFPLWWTHNQVISHTYTTKLKGIYKNILLHFGNDIVLVWWWIVVNHNLSAERISFMMCTYKYIHVKWHGETSDSFLLTTKKNHFSWSWHIHGNLAIWLMEKRDNVLFQIYCIHIYKMKKKNNHFYDVKVFFLDDWLLELRTRVTKT